MKMLFPVLALLAFNQAQACIGEAQIIARVTGLQKLGNTCFAQVDTSSIRFYAENITCPLDQYEVVQSGIQIGMKSQESETCVYNVGDELSGVVYKTEDGQLHLE